MRFIHSPKFERLSFLMIIVGLLNYSPLSAQMKIYVSPTGNDANSGTKTKPVASFFQAQTISRRVNTKTSVEVIFEKGVYYLHNTIQFTSKDSKAKGASITYTAEKEGEAIISGGSLLQLKWEVFKEGIYVATVPKTLDIHQLYINNKRQRMARFPNAIPDKNVYDTWTLSHKTKADAATDALSTKRIATWKNPEGGYIHAMHRSLWGDMHWIITGKKSDTSLNYMGGWQNNRPAPMHPLYRMVENIFEELDAPEEWYFNKKEGKLYYMPPTGTDLKTVKVEIVRLKHLIEFNGEKNNPVSNVHLNGFVFRHAVRTFMDNKEPLLRSDWTIYRGGAVVYNGAEDCKLSNCEFDQVGGNTIFVNNYNRRIHIDGCYIHHSGASGVVFEGNPACVRNALVGYTKQDYSSIDLTKGPKGDDFPEDCTIENCLITLTGRDEKQTAPIHISMSHKITVNHCSIYDVPRAGININEGTFGGHIIENCDIFNTVLETGDHGSFNSWGRDRYWTTSQSDVEKEVAKNTDLPFLDMIAPNIIRHNRWRCDHGWDIDLDDGSTRYRIYNNLLLSGGLKLREGYDRIATNNVIINNSLNPHVWFENSGDIFKNNIVCTGYKTAGMDRYIAKDGQWGKEIDANFFTCNALEMSRFIKNQCDTHSLSGDPMFVNPVKGDFRVRDSSLALKIGFRNFSMNDFGVTKPSLKAIVKTPIMPEVQTNSTAISQAFTPSHSWMGIPIKEPKGDEMSAYGVGFDEGGIALLIVDGEAGSLGFKTGDLIQGIDDVKVNSIQNFKDFLLSPKASNASHVFTIVRSQVKMKLMVKESLSNKILK